MFRARAFRCFSIKKPESTSFMDMYLDGLPAPGLLPTQEFAELSKVGIFKGFNEALHDFAIVKAI